MNRQASLGDLITALYDAASEESDEDSTDSIVAACTVDVLMRLRRRRLVAELVLPSDALPN
jgi:hypothetical protein